MTAPGVSPSIRSCLHITRALDPRCGEDDGGWWGLGVPVAVPRTGVGGKGVGFPLRCQGRELGERRFGFQLWWERRGWVIAA